MNPEALNLAGWCHVGYFGVLLPGLTVLLRKKVIPASKPLPNRLRHFQATATEIVILTLLSLSVGALQGISLFPPTWPSLWAAIVGVAAYLAAVTYMWPRWRRAVERRARVVHLYMPANAVERGWWIAVAILAGTGEEITWRGVQGTLVTILTGNYWIAAVLCSISFALGHSVQGWRSVVVVFVFAMCFATLVWLAGSLYVAMAVHVAYDITAGITYGRLGRELAPEGLDSARGSES
jgi:membrane protease YdiL (CAAX protease family)